MANFDFICGNDSFLVQDAAKSHIEKLKASLAPDCEIESLEGAANTVVEAETLVTQIHNATQSLSLFAADKIIWVKNCTLFGDNRTAKAEGTLQAIESLQSTLEAIDPAQTKLLIEASPVDRRTSRFKWFQKNSNCQFIDDKHAQAQLTARLQEHARSLNVRIASGALEVLLSKVNQNGRLALAELEKLACYLGPDSTDPISEPLVIDMVPDFGEGEFFEIIEAFFSRDTRWTLQAIDRFFFTQKESRPILAAMQNRNRLLIQMKALMDAGQLNIGRSGVDKAGLQAIASSYSLDPASKSTFNLPSQNPWYLGRLAQSLSHFKLKTLTRLQADLFELFQAFLSQPDAQAQLWKNLCLKYL